MAALRPAERIASFRHNTLLVAGFEHGERAFVGPRLVQIDPVNRCNNRCLACWCHSPLLGSQTMPPEEEARELPAWLLVGLLEKLGRMGTREIYFSGGGEPFLHPAFELALATASRIGMEVTVHTNLLAVDEPMLRLLVRLRIARLRVSLWAGSGEVYAGLHPGRDEEDFDRIRRRLGLLARLKGDRGRPQVLLHNVLCTKNASDTGEMVRLAAEVEAEGVSFVPLDVVPGATDGLAMTVEDARTALRGVERARQEVGSRVRIHAEEVLRSRLLAEDTEARDARLVGDGPCFSGWAFARIDASGNLLPCLKAHRIPLGNVHESPFEELWNGERAREFRRASRIPANCHPLLERIGNGSGPSPGCFRACDQIETNRTLEEKRRSFGAPRRWLVGAVSRTGGG